MGWGEPRGPVVGAGWHPEPVGDVALLRSELDACRAEIARLRVRIGQAEVVLDAWCVAAEDGESLGTLRAQTLAWLEGA